MRSDPIGRKHGFFTAKRLHNTAQGKRSATLGNSQRNATNPEGV